MKAPEQRLPSQITRIFIANYTTLYWHILLDIDLGIPHCPLMRAINRAQKKNAENGINYIPKSKEFLLFQ